MSYLVYVDATDGRVVNMRPEPASLDGINLGFNQETNHHTLVVPGATVGALLPHEFINQYRYVNNAWVNYGTPPGTHAVISGGAWTTNTDTLLAAVRQERNLRLAQTDYTQLNDAPYTNEVIQSFATYRQNLRDMTEDLDVSGKYEVDDITFPIL